MPGSESSDEDALFATLERESDQLSDPALIALRSARIQSLSAEFSRAKSARNEGYGTYTTLTIEKELLDLTTSTKKCIVHFYKNDFNRCRIMDGHLGKIAERHLETRVMRMDVCHAPFLVERLGVKVLPCVIGFVNGVGVDRVVGFEGLVIGQSDDFETGQLEGRFEQKGVLERLKATREELLEKSRAGGSTKTRRNDQTHNQDDDDDDDWD